MDTKSTQALREYKARDSLNKREAVLRVIDELGDTATPVSISEIARRAGVHRQFIHKHRDLWRRVKELEVRKADLQARAGGDLSTLLDGREADRATLAQAAKRYRGQVESLSERVKELEEARARHLGEQLAAFDAPTPVDAAEMAFTNERLRARNDDLRRELDEAKRLIIRLRDDLAGTRQALAEVLNEKAETGSVIIDLDGRR